jgi:hypothetical protein
MQAIFPKAMLGLGVGWTHFHKITPTNSKKVLAYGVCLSHCLSLVCTFSNHPMAKEDLEKWG